LQQKQTRVLSCTSESKDDICELLAKHPDKARQLQKLIVPCFNDLNVVKPEFKSLTHLETSVYCHVSFDCLLQYATSTLKKLESVKIDGTLKHSKLFSAFIEANQNSLTHLQMPNYVCSTTDFKLVTTVCTQLEALELDCEKVSAKNLLKIVSLKNITGCAISSVTKI
jgi:hypothetical protein